jgi:hypothetical protein
MEVTTDEKHDATVAEKLVDQAERNAGSMKDVLGDSVYGSGKRASP